MLRAAPLFTSPGLKVAQDLGGLNSLPGAWPRPDESRRQTDPPTFTVSRASDVRLLNHPALRSGYPGGRCHSRDDRTECAVAVEGVYSECEAADRERHGRNPPPAEIEPPGSHQSVDNQTCQCEGKRIPTLIQDAASRCSTPREQQHAHADSDHRERWTAHSAAANAICVRGSKMSVRFTLQPGSTRG